MRVVENDTYPERRDALSQDWAHLISHLFPQAILVPILNDPQSVQNVFEQLKPNAVILSNGNDWGEAQDRDNTEAQILKQCIDRHIPLLGVCRGHQVINVFFSGTICPDIKQKTQTNHVGNTHPITLSSPFGHQTFEVNSFHNQGLCDEDLAPSLKAFARSPDHVIEGIYHPDLPILGIQWHPERKTPNATFDSTLITRFFYEGAYWQR